MHKKLLTSAVMASILGILAACSATGTTSGSLSGSGTVKEQPSRFGSSGSTSTGTSSSSSTTTGR